ncbi:hypothetical protein [Fodinibius halophilus]|uniref:Photosynthesis system II assembly factor Ycf48/Hcf136-like domain-containing protein n=1 Tax=Fodinibius halophilus TaxID=1736908 RepID=A0A6M1T8D5_9BACT|nr:hypothetical protein [Fodinibius halophilus]NGP88271.1 hypothetical protein [Fodinibius halophilus]
MNKIIRIPTTILFLGCLLVLAGCHIFGNQKETEPEYIWQKMDGFADQEIRELALRDDETLAVATDSGIYINQSLDQPLQRADLPASLDFSIVREIITSDTLFYFSTFTFVNQMWSSVDGQKWELLLTKKKPMFNIWITPQGNRIIGTWHGVYRQLGGTSDVELVTFLYTDHFAGLDRITSVTQTSSGALFCGSHDGVYRSLDDGLKWVKVSHDIHKSKDFVVALYTDSNNHIYAQTLFGELYRSEDDGDSWEKMGGFDGLGVKEATFPGNETVVAMTSEAVWKASLTDGKFRKVGPDHSPEYKKMGAIENGKIVVATDSSLFIGVPNPSY